MVAGVIHACLSASAPGNASSLMAIVCLVQKDIMLQENVLNAQITVTGVVIIIVIHVTKDLQI